MSSRYRIACFLTTAVLAGVGLARAQTTPAEWHAPMLPAGTHPVTSSTNPRWADEPLTPTSDARISRMVEGRADVVVLDSGYFQGFRNGEICLVRHGDQAVARMIVVATEQNRSAALILDKPADVILIPGDAVRLSAL